jgi:ferric enterobactin receptor
MKKIYFLAIATFLTIQLFAQFPMGGGAGKPGQAPPSIGNVYGKLIDSLGKPVGDASVVMLVNRMDTVTKKRKDVLLKAIITKSNGEFNFSELPVFGGLKLKISAIGFKPLEKSVAFQMKMEAPAAAKPSGDPAGQMSAMSGMLNSFVKDLGNIQMIAEARVLENVTVTTTASALRLDIDKKV